MSIQISGTDVINNARKGIFQSANVGAFNPGNRPGSAATGDLIYNTSTAQLEVWNGSAWEKACGATEVAATGGNLTYDHNGNRVHIFSSPGTFSVSTGGVVEYVIVAGGGGGADGGGGGGGFLSGYFTVSSSPGSYPITIGSGGSGNPPLLTNATQGNPSSAFGNTAIGGGYGGIVNGPGNLFGIGGPGGNGGGGGSGYLPAGKAPIPTFPQRFSGGAGTPGQGTPGMIASISPTAPAPGGGGGGSGSSISPPASSTSLNATGNDGIVLSGWGIPPSYGDPGPSLLASLPTNFTAFSGGGGGSRPFSGPGPSIAALLPIVAGGTGGGGRGGSFPTVATENGLSNSGGGGGGGRNPPGSGGSGIVLIRYRKTP